MENKYIHIFVSACMMLLISGIVYILIVFLFPSVADRYFPQDINNKVRHIKDSSLTISSETGALNIPFSHE